MIESLGKMNIPEVIKPLIKFLNDKSGFVREQAARALREIKYPKKVKHFIKLLNKSENKFF